MAKVTITSVSLTLGDLKEFIYSCKDIPDSTPLKMENGKELIDVVHIEGDINEIAFYNNI